MKLALALCTSLLLSAGIAAGVDSDNTQAAAQLAALNWLALVDTGNYAQSWSSAATVFRQKITSSQWQTAVANARTPLGALRTRTLESATATHSLPGAPDGDYVVIKFASSFENKASAVETVTPMKDTDGKWHVSGYYIK
jgi:hypothetical protein